jgi:cysteine desulfurase
VPKIIEDFIATPKIFLDYISFEVAAHMRAIITADMNMDRTYLDYAATTPVDKRVLEHMLGFFSDDFGNPSSLHYYGQAADGALTQAHRQLLALMHAEGGEVIFTSGGSESDNLALRGVVSGAKGVGTSKVLTSPVEHPAIGNTGEALAANGEIALEKLKVDQYGLVSEADLSAAIDADTKLVSIIWANNEIGTINDIAALGRVSKERGVVFHTDAVQAAAHLVLDWRELNCDLLSFGAHKFYGPKGIGGLLKRKELPIVPQVTGGGQENDLRAGTQNVPLIMGMRRAYEIVCEERETTSSRLSHMRDIVIEEVLRAIDGAHLTGHPQKRLPNHASFVFEEVSGQDLVVGLDMAGYAVSSGSACKVGNPKPSQTLLAIGIPADLARGALRVTLGRHTTETQIRSFLVVLRTLVWQLRKNSHG